MAENHTPEPASADVQRLIAEVDRDTPKLTLIDAERIKAAVLMAAGGSCSSGPEALALSLIQAFCAIEAVTASGLPEASPAK
jgi:hypothetical protein